MKRNRRKTFIIGGIIGTLIGIMLAPKSGSETRSELTDRSQKLKSRANEMAANVRTRLGPTVESARERVGPVVDQVASRVRRGKSGNQFESNEDTEDSERGSTEPKI